MISKIKTHLILALCSIPVSVTAAPVSWNEAVDTRDKSQLLGGRVIAAINGGNPVTISNGGSGEQQDYTFSAGTYANANFSPQVTSRVFSNAGSAGTGDPNFDSLINSFAYVSSGADSVRQTIQGLTPGREYAVQIFYNDQRANFANRVMRFSDDSSPPQQVTIGAAGAGWGQHVVGTFVADSNSQQLSHTAVGFANAHVSAMLVVESEGVEPEPVGEPDSNLPSATFHHDSAPGNRSFPVFLTFSEDVNGLSANDIDVDNGSVQAISGQGRYYTIDIQAAEPGDVVVSLSAGTGSSQSITIRNQGVSANAWIVDDQQDWIAASQSTNMQINNGAIMSQSASSTFSSVIRTFPVRQKASNFTLDQLPVWDNWIPVNNVGPADARNAPVLIVTEDNNYHLLAQGNTDGYHAWHSTNMRDWEEMGPVTPPNANWVTSAEYKDGEYFIYADQPNDQTPHLYIDDDLNDGIVGVSQGDAFVKDSCGSDASIFRNDTDGLFHLIYEDWTPINARQNSWDSPLAGHASSEDGLTGFENHEHMPAVDHRSLATGTVQTYAHPQIGTCEYEVHSPAQDAYGDWTTIKVGDQYYLFSDFDQHDSGIRVGRFTSDSIYKEFELVGSLGNGHPDPTVAFAEGQFYLLTQQQTDYVSPGPWVDGVEARVGVDQDGDQLIDTWTPWQTLEETYNHKPGFARVVQKTPAQIDLTALPSGVGFQFQLRLDNTLADSVVPVIDRAELTIEPDPD